MKKTITFSILVMITVLSSCSNNRSNAIGVRDGSTIIVDASSVRDTIDIALSKWIENLEIIQMDDSTIEAFFAHPHILISENYIGIFEDSKPFKLFDRKSGKFLYKIGDIGRGPGEYNNIYSAQIDETADRIYILHWPKCNSIMAFDINGKFIGEIPLAFTSNKGKLRVDSKNRKVIVSTIPFDLAGKVVWQQDFEGNLIGGEGAFALQYPNFDNEIFYTGNTSEFDFQIYTNCLFTTSKLVDNLIKSCRQSCYGLLH